MGIQSGNMTGTSPMLATVTEADDIFVLHLFEKLQGLCRTVVAQICLMSLQNPVVIATYIYICIYYLMLESYVLLVFNKLFITYVANPFRNHRSIRNTNRKAHVWQSTASFLISTAKIISHEH